MTPTIVLSQMSDRLNDRLRARAPGAQIRSWPPGPLRCLPEEARVLIPMPFVRAGDKVSTKAPPGWPFGIQWVQLFTAGLDYYPQWMFDGCDVCGAGGASARSVAEFAIAAVMAAAKRLPESWINVAQDWRRRGPLDMVAGATLGIVGFGAIGRQVASIGVALGMNVQVARRSTLEPDIPGTRRCAEITTLFETSDHVVLALSGGVENYGIIDDDVLRFAKRGLHLVNVARGRLVDEDALLAALGDGRVSRATLDVAYPEPLPDGHPFYRHAQILLSPHVSFDTSHTERALIETFAGNLDRFCRGEALPCIASR